MNAVISELQRKRPNQALQLAGRCMLRFHVVALLLLAVSFPTFAEEAGKNPDDSWMQQYYQHPQPERFEAEVKKMQESGALHDQKAIPPVGAFFSRLFLAAQPAQLAKWLKFIEGLPEADKQVFLVGLRLADSRETKDALHTIASHEGRAAIYAKKILDAESPVLDKMTDLAAPTELDLCWGAFFATGDPVYALPVIRCATKPVKAKTIDMGREAAQWSLKALCGTHKKLRDIKDAFYKTASPEERKALDELFKE